MSRQIIRQILQKLTEKVCLNVFTRDGSDYRYRRMSDDDRDLDLCSDDEDGGGFQGSGPEKRAHHNALVGDWRMKVDLEMPPFFSGEETKRSY